MGPCTTTHPITNRFASIWIPSETSWDRKANTHSERIGTRVLSQTVISQPMKGIWNRRTTTRCTDSTSIAWAVSQRTTPWNTEVKIRRARTSTVTFTMTLSIGWILTAEKTASLLVPVTYPSLAVVTPFYHSLVTPVLRAAAAGAAAVETVIRTGSREVRVRLKIRRHHFPFRPPNAFAK